MSYWTPARDEKLKLLWSQQDKNLQTIALELSTLSVIDCRVLSGASISSRAKYLKLSPRHFGNKKRFSGTDSTTYMMNEAKKRGIPLTELVRRIMATVQSDKMVDAILDDQHSIAPLSAQVDKVA